MSSLEKDRPTSDAFGLMNDAAQLLTILDLDGILKRAIDMAVELTRATRANLFLFEGHGMDWKRVGSVTDADPDCTCTVVPHALDTGVAGWVARNKQATLVNDTHADPRWYVTDDPERMARSAVCLPFIHNDQVIATIALLHPQPHAFTEDQLRRVQVIINHGAIALGQARLFNQMRAQQRQLETVLYTIPDAILVLDANGCLLMANHTAMALLGNTPEADITGKRVTEIPNLDAALTPLLEIIEEIGDSPLRAGTQWSFETRSETLKKDLQASILVWEDRAQDMAGYVVAMHDVTQLRDLHRFKDEMLRVASHDLRSPLSLIIGYTDMIALDLQDDESPVHEHVEVIRRSTERMSELLDDLLRVERIRTSPLELHEQVDPEKLVKVVLVNMRPFAVAKHQEFVAELDLKDVSGIMADPVLIRQAMENLIGNAIKYTPEGGRITIEAYPLDDYLYFEVQDTGIGIPKEDVPYIFNSFYRVKSEAVTQTMGKGLGLSLVKTVIERHHGEIWVKSEPGKGSRFTFRIPL